MNEQDMTDDKKIEKGKLVGVCNCICHCGIECATDHSDYCSHCVDTSKDIGMTKLMSTQQESSWEDRLYEIADLGGDISISNARDFIQSALQKQREEIVEKIEKERLRTKTGIAGKSYILGLSDQSTGFNKGLDKAIELIKGEE